ANQAPTHATTDSEAAAARKPGETPVAHPAQARVQRAEEVHVRPVGPRAVVQGGAKPGPGDVPAGGELHGLLDTQDRAVGLRQVVETAREELAQRETDETGALIDHEVDTATGDGAAGLGVQLGQS